MKGKENTIRKPKKTSDDEKVCVYISLFMQYYIFTCNRQRNEKLQTAVTQRYVSYICNTINYEQALANIIVETSNNRVYRIDHCANALLSVCSRCSNVKMFLGVEKEAKRK